jgi:hypothetical protein
MSASILPIKLYGGVLGPNPLKVSLILTALKLPFESILIPMDQLKKPDYEAINPNAGFRRSMIQTPTSPSGRVVLSLSI